MGQSNQIAVLIVEDEFSIAMDIELRLEKMNYNVVGIANSYEEALAFLLEEQVDIAILDVNLEKEKTGIDLAKMIHKKFDLPFIFLTAYTDDGTINKALEVEPMGYISKPFKDVDIHSAIQLGIKKHALKSANQEIQSVQISPEVSNFFVKDKGMLKKIEKSDLIWIEAMDNYTVLHLIQNKYVINGFLKDNLEKLQQDIIRIHRSYAVNKNKITAIEDNTLYIDDLSFTISKSYKQKLLENLNLL